MATIVAEAPSVARHFWGRSKMPDTQCLAAMDVLNNLLSSGVIQGDAALVARLEAGEHPADILEDIGDQYTTSEQTQNLITVLRGWPDLHVEMATRLVGWALARAATGEVLTVLVNGDNQSPNTITRATLQGTELRIEFEHPPSG